MSDSTLWRLLAAQTTAGLRQMVAPQVRRLRQPSGALPLGVMSIDGKLLWTSVQREVPGLKPEPEQFRGFLDALFVNEAERTWPQLLRDPEAGKVQRKAVRDRYWAGRSRAI